MNLPSLNPLATNCTVLDYGYMELLFSYKTLVGVKTINDKGYPTFYCQRDGKAASPTTARHITKWIGSNESDCSPIRLSESGLAKLAEPIVD